MFLEQMFSDHKRYCIGISLKPIIVVGTQKTMTIQL